MSDENTIASPQAQVNESEKGETTNGSQNQAQEQNGQEAQAQNKEEIINTPTPEAAKEAKEKATFMALARKEKELRLAQKSLNAQQREASAYKEQLAKLTKTVEDLQAKLSDPFKAIEHSGRSLAELNELALNDGNPTPEMKIKALEMRLERMASESEERNKQREDALATQRKKEIEDGINAFKAETYRFIETKRDEFPVTYSMQQEGLISKDLVSEIIEQHFYDSQDTAGKGELLTIEQAAKIAEDYLEKKQSDILSKEPVAKKFAGKFNFSGQKLPTNNSSQKDSKTITNHVVNQSNPRSGLTRDESLAEAAKLIRWVED